MRSTFFLFLLTSLLITAAAARAQDAKDDVAKLETTPENRMPASQVEFNSELQVPLQALSDLGQTIETAREKADPVVIASAANVLRAAESLAGDKRAAITSDQLWEEAIALAKRRKSSAELAVLASLASGDAAADLKAHSDAAKADEEDAKQAEEAGETTRDLHGDLHIINRSHDYVHLYVDGHYIGAIRPHAHKQVHLHGAYHLEGRSRYHRWHEDIHGHEHHYDWVLRDPHHP